MRGLPGLMLLGCLLAAGTLPSHAAGTGAAHVVTIEAMQFSPPTLEVKVGDTVTWKNKDPFPHNVASPDGQVHSGDLQGGATWKFKARKKGVYPYVCTLHPGMKATLVVK
jgi:plastocyanin